MKPKRLLAIALIAAAAVAVVAAGEEKIVTLKNGRQIVGEVTKTEDGYEIRKPGGVLIVIAADDVASITEAKTAESEFQRQLAKTDQKDPEQMYQLARWAMDQDMLTEAKDLLQKVLKLKADHENAQLLLKLVEIRLKTVTRPPPPETTTREKPTPSELLTEEDMYRIRLVELRPGDRVRVRFRDKLLERFIDSMRGTGVFAEPGGRARFLGASQVEQVQYILQNTDRDSPLRNDILIESDPSVMTEFRTRIWPIVLKGCATTQCHGGVKGAGALRLFGGPTTRDQVVYTNFYLLSTWSRGGKMLIHRDKPEMSLLLQYGLPQELAQFQHPVAIDLLFRDREDRDYKLILDWIKSLRFPVPGGATPYGVSYKIPGQPEKPTTAPSIFD